MINFGKIIYSNKKILEHKHVSMVLILLLFIINISLVTSPLFVARAQIEPETVIERFDGLEEAFEEIYAADQDCLITANMTCDLPSEANGYEVVLTGEPTTEKYIWFAEEMVIKEEYIISGTYDFLQGISLNPDDEYENTKAIIYSMSASTLGRDYYFLYVGQFIQNILYLIAISLLIMVANYKQVKRRVKYPEAIKITVMGMLGPAIASALIGLFLPQFSTLIFMTIYSLRMMYIYFQILRPKNS